MSVNYMLISIIILAVAIAIPFFTFEKRKPKARHVVMIAVIVISHFFTLSSICRQGRECDRRLALNKNYCSDSMRSA